MIKQGDVAFLKTTGEACFVLEIHDKPLEVIVAYGDYNKKTGTYDNQKKVAVSSQTAWVRRPTQSDNGIHHLVEPFGVQELETLDDQRKRFLAESEKVLKKYGPKTDTAIDPTSLLSN